MSKFAKKAVTESNAKPQKGGLTINLDKDKPRIVKNGAEATKESHKDAQLKANKASAGKAAKGKAVKATKEKAERAPREADTRKIKILTEKKANPKREGSASYDRFELYRDSKTVADFVAAGGSTADIRYDEKAGYIEVA